MLLVPLLPTNEDIPFTLVTQIAQYVKVRLAEYNKKLSPSVPSLDNKIDNGLDYPVQDPHEQVLSNTDKLAKWTK